MTGSHTCVCRADGGSSAWRRIGDQLGDVGPDLRVRQGEVAIERACGEWNGDDMIEHI